VGDAPVDRILHALKTSGPLSTAEIAKFLGLSLPGARRHLKTLDLAGLAVSEPIARGVGRPKQTWNLTGAAQRRFPDGHEALIVELIAAIRDLLGEKALDRLIRRREDKARRAYAEALRPLRGLAARVEKLATLRSGEGYMAEWRQESDSSFLLVENHCPIRAAARTCQGFCRSELELFEASLRRDAKVTRIEHIVGGARRCAYRIERRHEQRG
jgi:predicted ArsR family transcriptional regulator